MKQIGILVLALAACSDAAEGVAAEPTEENGGGSVTSMPATGSGGGSQVGSGGAPQTGAGGSMTSSAGSAPGGSAGASSGKAGATGSGGSAGTAGSGGAGTARDGGMPPHVVGKCDGLAGVGVWENVSPPAHAAMFVVDPVNAGTVYVGTSDPKRGGVFKTTDCGANWVHISTGRNGDGIDAGGQWTMAIDPTDPKVLYTNSGYAKDGLFKSTNGGVDWDDITPKGDGAPGFAGNLQMDPDDPRHLLLTWHNNCGVYADGIGCFAETKDGGATWKEHYGTPKWPPQVRVLLLHGSSWIVLADTMLLTKDGGATFSSVLGTAAGGHSSGTLSRMKNGDYYVGMMYGLIRSPAASAGGEWSTLSNSGQWVGDVAESATTRFATHQQGIVTKSPSTDGMKWTEMPGSPTSEFAGYDRDHRILYVSGSTGLFRVVTE